MADLELALSWLDMSQYLERFLQAGFDSWETVLDITENDLEVLNVEMGHRKKLQKEIANSSMLAGDPPSITPSGPIPHVQATSQMDSGSLSSNNPLASSGKRGYRHHPRPDPNAPKRPYSAYVLFSNMVRDDLRVQLLSFAELSRRVGDRWQSLSTEQKEVWKQKAAEPLEKYNIALTKYQKSEEGKEYRSYLLDFRSTQPAKKINAKVLKRELLGFKR